MPFRKLLPLFAALVAFSSASAHAQAGVYGTFSGQKFGGITCPSFLVGGCGQNDGNIRPYGITIGGYYDFRNFGPVRFGVDVRGDVLTSNKRADSSSGGSGITHQYAALGGVRGEFRARPSWVHPYVEVLAGMTRNNAVGNYVLTPASGTSEYTTTFNPNLYKIYPTFKGVAGADMTILPWLDLRAEVTAGESFGQATAVTVLNADGTVATSTSSSSTHFQDSIGGGLVFHIPR